MTHLTVEAARDCSLEVTFEAIPYSESICFRPPLPNKPQIAGTVPARVTSTQQNDPYGHIDLEGRYRVNFLFDRDSWKAGEESVWLRLARPYAGDTHGLHLPLICGTEVAVAFEHGDPEAREWLPGGQLLLDLQVLLEVYLGWRCTAKLQLSIPLRLLPVPVLGRKQVRLGMTAVLGLPTGDEAKAHADTITVNLGRYQGLQLNPCNREVAHVAYRF